MYRGIATRFAFVLGLAIGTWPIGDAAYAHQVRRAVPHYGGQVTDTGRYHVELLIDENRHLRVYVRRAGGMAVPPEDIEASAVMIRESGSTSLTIEQSGHAYLVSSAPIASYRSVEVLLDLAYGGRLTARLRASAEGD